MEITLATLESASGQAIFDHVATRLLAQGQKSIGSNGFCAYRGEGGLKCAVGHCMTDEEYDPDFDKLGKWWKVVAKYGISHRHDTLLEDLQWIHDREDPSMWAVHLKSLASSRMFKLPDCLMA